MAVVFENLRDEFERFERHRERPLRTRKTVTPVLKRLHRLGGGRGRLSAPPEDPIQLRDLMSVAGEALFAAVKRGFVVFDPVPAWIGIDPWLPPPRQPGNRERDEYGWIHCWDTYWWCALVVLAEQRRDAGVVMPPQGIFSGISPSLFSPLPYSKSRFHRAMRLHHVAGALHKNEDYSVEARAIAASIAACRFLASLQESDSGTAGDLDQRPASPHYSHSDDFTAVKWFGKEFVFNPRQALAVEVLWRAWETRHPQVLETRIAGKLDAVDSRFRMLHLFRKKRRMHPAWDTMIKRIDRGIYALVETFPQVGAGRTE